MAGLKQFYEKLKAESKGLTQSKKEDDLPRGFVGAKLMRKAQTHMLTRLSPYGTSPGKGPWIQPYHVRERTQADMPRSQRQRSIYMPHQGKRECLRRMSQENGTCVKARRRLSG